MTPVDPEKNYWYTARTHAPMYLELYLTCPYDSACTSAVAFGYVVQTMEKDGHLYSAVDFEYTFISDDVTDEVKLASRKSLQIHSDDHVYFSLIDSTGAEKSYDIDLSGMIHSWTRRGDSVNVMLPDYVDNLAISCPWQSSGSNLCWFYNDSLPDHVVIMGYDKSWGNIYYLEAGLNGQSSYGTDSVFVSASIHWRPDSL